MEEIIRITPIETAEQFVRRLEGGVGFGLNSQKGSEVTTFNANADIRYRTREYLVGLNLNSSITDQPSEDTQSRHTAMLNYQRFRANRWYTDWFGSWERNDQLGIESRFSIGAGLGRYLVQTNRNHFSLMAGAQATREEFTGQDPGDTIGEARIQVRWLHRSLKPESSMTFTTNYYPVLEDPSIYRMESSLVFSREFIADLDFELDLYYTYQSEPPTEGSRTDNGIITSLSYSW
jgi:putative salt-induced outer membrane protein YdiY